MMDLEEMCPICNRNVDFKLDQILNKMDDDKHFYKDQLKTALGDVQNQLTTLFTELRSEITNLKSLNKDNWYDSAYGNAIDASSTTVKKANKVPKTPSQHNKEATGTEGHSTDILLPESGTDGDNDKISELLKNATTENVQQAMLLIFEKSIREPNSIPAYAKFWKMFQQDNPEFKQQVFHTSFIKRIQVEFETNVNSADAKNEKLKQLIEKMDDCTDPKERLDLQAELEDQDYQFRRRALGTLRWMGEMYKLQSLTGDRVMLCIESLLEHGTDEKLEYMCALLTTVGHLLEAKVSRQEIVTRMDRIFNKINEIIKASRSNKNATSASKISSHVLFMLQDVVDLRARQWDQNKKNAIQIVSGAGGSNSNSNSQQQNRQGNRSNYNDVGGYGNNNQGRRNRAIYYNKNSNSKSQSQTQDQNRNSKKFNFSRGVDSSESTTKLGNSSIYMWRTSCRQTGGLLQNAAAPPFEGMSSSGSQQYGMSGGSNSNSSNTSMKHSTDPLQVLSTRESDNDRHQNSDVKRPLASHTFASCSSNEGSDDGEKSVVSYSTKEVGKVINGLVEDYMECMRTNSKVWYQETLSTWRSYSLKQHVELVHCLLMDYLHLRDVTKDHRLAAATIFSYLLKTKALDKKTFARSYDQFAEEFADVLVDVPNGWTYVFEFLGPLLHDRQLTFADIWRADWKDDRYFMQRFVKALIVHFTKEFGANYVRDVWHKDFKLDKGQLFCKDQQQWQEFINSQGLQYIYDANVKPPSDMTSGNSATVEKKVKRLQVLLEDGGDNDCDLAIDYINTNVNINDEFIRYFTRFLCCDYGGTVMFSSISKIPQVNGENFCKYCVPMLRLCIDSHEKYQVACIDAAYDGIQQKYSDYAAVDDITCKILDLLYHSDVITKESLDKWYRQRLEVEDAATTSKSSSGGGQPQQLSALLRIFLQQRLKKSKEISLYEVGEINAPKF